MSVEEFIIDIRENPERHLEENRIDYIYYLLFGFATPYIRDEAEIDIEFRKTFYKKVEDWARNKDKAYEQFSLHWFQIIQKYTFSEGEAVDVFYQLCAEFFAEERPSMCHEN